MSNKYAFGWWVITVYEGREDSRGPCAFYYDNERHAKKEADKAALEDGVEYVDVCKVQTSFYQSNEVVEENVQ
jgi:hypothetical protein